MTRYAVTLAAVLIRGERVLLVPRGEGWALPSASLDGGSPAEALREELAGTYGLAAVTGPPLGAWAVDPEPAGGAGADDGDGAAPALTLAFACADDPGARVLNPAGGAVLARLDGPEVAGLPDSELAAVRGAAPSPEGPAESLQRRWAPDRTRRLDCSLWG